MAMTQMSDDEVRAAVQDRYSAAARGSLGTLDESGGCCSSGSCCGSEDQVNDRCCAEPMHGVDPITSGLYDELANDPDHPFDAAIAASLGCGNPTALAQLNPGEDVLDLGSGGGLDVLLSAKRVGPDGMAYGLDMTPEMLALAERPTGNVAYVRWMGPNRDIVDYSRIQVDRSRELSSWSQVLPALAKRVRTVYGYVNNHFAGHSPASLRELQRLLGQPSVAPEDLGEQMSLF